MKKYGIAVLTFIGMAMMLAGCSGDTLTKTGSHKTNLPSGRYDLVYVDQNTDGHDMYTSDSYKPKSAIGLVHGGKAEEFQISADSVNEHVALKYANKPYVTIKRSGNGDMVDIYRGPYMQYIQPEANGTVKAK